MRFTSGNRVVPDCVSPFDCITVAPTVPAMPAGVPCLREGRAGTYSGGDEGDALTKDRLAHKQEEECGQSNDACHRQPPPGIPEDHFRTVALGTRQRVARAELAMQADLNELRGKPAIHWQIPSQSCATPMPHSLITIPNPPNALPGRGSHLESVEENPGRGANFLGMSFEGDENRADHRSRRSIRAKRLQDESSIACPARDSPTSWGARLSSTSKERAASRLCGRPRCGLLRSGQISPRYADRTLGWVLISSAGPSRTTRPVSRQYALFAI